MFNVCPGCGEYDDAKDVLPGGIAKCTSCGHLHSFVKLPLFVVTGASGTGKTSALLRMNTRLPECVCLESDILWRDEFNKDGNFLEYRNLWLRVAKNINQSYRPVVLFGSTLPGQFEECNESRYFSAIHYLAFVCAQDELVRRLTARPGWRKSGTDEVVERMISFNQWFLENAGRSGMKIVDTTDLDIEGSAAATEDWVRSFLPIPA